MRINVKIYIEKEPGIRIMGPGPLSLLERLKKYKSINKATRSMNLSYVKALNILNRLEKGVGRKMLIRERGGNKRGGTQLTQYAEKYMERYRQLEEEVNRFAQIEFQKFQKDLEEEGKNGHS